MHMDGIKTEPGRRGSTCCLGTVLGIPAVLLVGYFLLYLTGRLLVVSQAIQPVDAVVVLSGGEGRVEYAARLFYDASAKWFVITETGDWVPGNPEPVSEFDAVRANRLGVPLSAIYITPRETSNTAGEASVVRQMIEDTGVRSIMVVTDPFHTRRAQLLFWHALRGSGVQLRMRAVEGHPYRPATWWLSDQWRRETVQEYGKILYTLYGWVR